MRPRCASCACSAASDCSLAHPSLRELRQLVASLPALQTLHAPCEVTSVADALAALAAPPPLRLSGLHVWLPSMGSTEALRWTAFSAALARAPLPHLGLVNADIPDGDVDALAGALGAAGVRCLDLLEVDTFRVLERPELAARGRLIGSFLRATQLQRLRLKMTHFTSRAHQPPYFNAASADVLAPALRAAASLRALTCEDVNLFGDAQAALTLLEACTAHPSLRSLQLWHYRGMPQPEIPAEAVAPLGLALAALVTAPGTRLRLLLLHGTALGDALLRPLLEALPRAPRLRRLLLEECGLTAACCARVLLPAVRAAPRLLQLHLLDDVDAERDTNPGAAEACDLVRQRYPFVSNVPFHPDDQHDVPTDDEEEHFQPPPQ
jgi:hypothetical protein